MTRFVYEVGQRVRFNANFATVTQVKYGDVLEVEFDGERDRYWVYATTATPGYVNPNGVWVDYEF